MWPFVTYGSRLIYLFHIILPFKNGFFLAHYQLRNFPEAIFYDQQCIRVDADCSEAYSNLGNALKELGDIKGGIQFYLKAIKLNPRNGDAYNNLCFDS